MLAALNSLQTKVRVFSSPFAFTQDLYKRKLYHELTLKLEDAVANPAFQQASRRFKPVLTLCAPPGGN